VVAILDVPYKRYKNKNIFYPNIIMIHLQQKRFMKGYLYWCAHRESYVSHETTIKKMIGSTSSSSNVHEIVDNYL